MRSFSVERISRCYFSCRIKMRKTLPAKKRKKEIEVSKKDLCLLKFRIGT